MLIRSLFSRFLAWQLRLQQQASRWFDRLLPDDYLVDGCKDFAPSVVMPHLRHGDVVWDIGAGRYPLLDHRTKSAIKLTSVGLDVDAQEMDAAAVGLYDRTVCADLLTYRGSGDADAVICRSLLEHVRDTEKALAAITSILKPGAFALIFVPSRNALYAKLNRIIPERLKNWLLRRLVHVGEPFKAFPAYYDRCTPREFQAMSRRCGLEVVAQRTYFISAYFEFLFPLYVAWRIWLLGFRALAGDQAAETFAMVLRRRS